MRERRGARPLRLAIAFAVALGLWIALAPALHAWIVGAARALARPEGVFVAYDDAMVVWPVAAPTARVRVPMEVLTSNLVLLATLWAWDAGAFRRRGHLRFAGALAALVGVAILAAVAALHATLAVTLAEHTGARYGTLEANAWFLLWQGYQVIGAWALAFAAWFLGRENHLPQHTRMPSP